MCAKTVSRVTLPLNILLYYLDLPTCANVIFIKEGEETAFVNVCVAQKDLEWGFTGCLSI